MHDLFLAIIVFVTFIAGGLIALYYWGTDNFSKSNWFSTAGLSLSLGYAAIGALGISYLLCSIMIGAYVAYFVYLKDYQSFTPITERSMVSIASGVVIGMSGLIGCIVCAQ